MAEQLWLYSNRDIDANSPLSSPVMPRHLNWGPTREAGNTQVVSCAWIILYA